MSYGELYIEPIWTGRNKQNGKFLKGHVPHNKGKKWDEYMSKEGQQKVLKTILANIRTHRPRKRPYMAERYGKQVVSVMDDGRWTVHTCISSAAVWVGGIRENVRRCCQYNEEKHVNVRSGKVNTDHKYKGVRFYYESDTIWMEKVKH